MKRVKEWLVKLAKAPLKPQQRLFILKEHLIPKLLHLSVLSRVRVGVLIKTDRLIRGFIRRHLDLPHDAINAFFHAPIIDGGFVISSLRLSIPCLRVKRLRAIAKCFSDLACGGFVNDFLHVHLGRAMDASLPGDHESYWSNIISTSIDGGGLKESSKTPGQHV